MLNKWFQATDTFGWNGTFEIAFKKQPLGCPGNVHTTRQFGYIQVGREEKFRVLKMDIPITSNGKVGKKPYVNFQWETVAGHNSLSLIRI